MISRPWSLLMAGALLAACSGAPDTGDKIQFDLGRLDAEGLQGQAGGKLSLSYEFCTPDRPDTRSEVAAVDPSVRFSCSSPGRIGCGPGECLTLGDSHHPEHRRRLLGLSALPYIRRIEESFFE